jgi:hypothetical protein
VSPSISAFLLLTALRGTLEISNRTLTGVRDEAALGPALYGETSPAVKLGLSARRWELTADYTPRFMWSPFGESSQSYIVQQARLAGRWQERRASITLSQDSGYGRQSLLSLASDQASTPGTTSLGALPAAQILDYAWSRTGLVYTLAPSRRWALSLAGDSALSGGTGASSRAALPFQTGLHGGIGAELAASRRDHLAMTLDLSRVLLSTGWLDVVLQGKTSWRRALGRNTVSTLAGGVGWASSQATSSAPAHAAAYPIAEASIAYRHNATSTGALLLVKVSPVVDRLTGVVDERLESMAAVTWSPTRAITVQGQLGVARSIPWNTPDALSAGSGGVSIAYRLNDVVQLDGGARTAWTTAASAVARPQWSAFAGITLRMPTLRF